MIGCIALFNGCVEKNKDTSTSKSDGKLFSQKSAQIVFPNNISQFRLQSNETINKTFVGTNITEESAVYLPNKGAYKYVKAVMIRIIEYPYSSITKTSGSKDSEGDIQKSSSDKSDIINRTNDQLSNYYAQIDSNPHFLPNVIGGMMERNQVSGFSSRSGVPMTHKRVMTLRDAKNGTSEEILDLTINYARVTIFTTGTYENFNKESSSVIDQIWNNTMELM